MRFYKTPSFFRFLYPELVWSGSRNENTLYLTFDDGPVPGITDRILDILRDFNIRATFFCVGENILKYPAIFNRMLDENHRVGNHTQHHLNAWKYTIEEILNDVQQCENTWHRFGYEPRIRLYRPPYGMIKRKLIRKLLPQYKIIMWDMLSYDFSPGMTPEKCVKASVRHTRPGSISVFHDSEKTRNCTPFSIYQYISYFLERNYDFSTIDTLFLQNR